MESKFIMLSRKIPVLLPVLVYSLLSSLDAAVPSTRTLIAVDRAVREMVAEGSIVGAQLMVGHDDQFLMGRNYGVRSASDDTPVDSETLFCIGSCSKPIASAVVLSLVDDGRLNLETGIEKWLPAFGRLRTADGMDVRAPNLIELLSHHSGIYSQKKGMTSRQSRWIRDFRLSLDTAVEGIAKEPLIAEPGTEYAYSGAGYCVIGRVAEEAGGASFEALLQARLCKPLGLAHTSYFPDSDHANIASGSRDGKPHPATPHFSKPFKLPLIGGSLYSTAGDSALFLQAVLQNSKGSTPLVSGGLFEQYTSPYSDEQTYALGWNVMMENGQPFGLRHSGALAASRAQFSINLESGMYFAFLYTISDPRTSSELQNRVSESLGVLTANSR